MTSRKEYQAQQRDLEAKADAAYRAGNKAEGRRLDDEAHEAWRRWQHLPISRPEGGGQKRLDALLGALVGRSK